MLLLQKSQDWSPAPIPTKKLTAIHSYSFRGSKYLLPIFLGTRNTYGGWTYMKAKHSHKLNKINLKRTRLRLYIGDSIPTLTVYISGSWKWRQMMSERERDSTDGTRTSKEEEKLSRWRG